MSTPVSQLIEQEAASVAAMFRADDAQWGAVHAALTRIAEAAAREAVRYLAVGDSQEWAEDEVVQAVLGAEDTKR